MYTGDVVKDAVAVVNAGGYEGVDKHSGIIGREHLSDWVPVRCLVEHHMWLQILETRHCQSWQSASGLWGMSESSRTVPRRPNADCRWSSKMVWLTVNIVTNNTFYGAFLRSIMLLVGWQEGHLVWKKPAAAVFKSCPSETSPNC